MKLGYWKIRGLAEAMRMLLTYAEADYEDVVYECGDAPDYDRSCWTDVKFTLGFEFPNLPYLEDGDMKLTQTIPIMHYISNKYGLTPKDFKVHAQCDMLDHVAMDLTAMGARLFYSSKETFEAGREGLIKNAQVIINQFDTFLGPKDYFAGDYITGTDFIVFETLDKYTVLEPTILENNKNLINWMDRIKKLPTLNKYFNEPTTRAWPLNNKMAYFK